MGDVERFIESLAAGRSGRNGVCGACLSNFPDITGVGLVVMSGASVRTPVCRTDEVSSRLEQLQFTLGVGPSVDAFTIGGPVLVGDLARDQRWPAFSQEAVAAGARAIFAFPLRVGAIRLGTLEMYRDRPGAMAEHEVADALLICQAITVLLLEGRWDGTSSLHDGMKPYRAEVHQATGMIMIQLGIPADEAFVRLRARAYVEGRLVEEIARDVVERRLRFERPEA